MHSARESGEMAFGSLPVWVATMILPLAFALIALRYGLRFMHHVQQARGREAVER
jgi:TRAP-type C4-dicarboxylate transport system permease small subunit